jgi:putative flippase GtrA
MALGVDMGLLLLLHHVVGLHYLLAAAIGFMAGLFVAYALSVRFAFSQRRVADARAEFILFASVGLLGLALTQILLHAFVDGTGMAVAAAKIVTAGFVFLFNFGARKVLLFTQVA